jgi:hypothetical protein
MQQESAMDTKQAHGVMDAEAVRAYVNAKWPNVLNGPLAQAMHGASAMTMLESSDADRVVLLADARDHARACIAARDGWTVETLGHNIESAFGMDLDADECDAIAQEALLNAA